MEQFGTTGALTAQGALGHEIAEGFQMQVKEKGAWTAHFDFAIVSGAGVLP